MQNVSSCLRKQLETRNRENKNVYHQSKFHTHFSSDSLDFVNVSRYEFLLFLFEFW